MEAANIWEYRLRSRYFSSPQLPISSLTKPSSINVGSSEVMLTRDGDALGRPIIDCRPQGFYVINVASPLLDQLSQNFHRLFHFFIGIEKVWGHAQANSGTAINKNFSFSEALHH